MPGIKRLVGVLKNHLDAAEVCLAFHMTQRCDIAALKQNLPAGWLLLQGQQFAGRGLA